MRDVTAVPPVVVRLGALVVVGWLVLGVWGYRLVLAGDIRGVIVPVAQLATGFTAYGMRTEPVMARWKGVLTVQAVALSLIGGLSAVSLLTVLIAG